MPNPDCRRLFALSIDIHGLPCGICISSEVALSRTTFHNLLSRLCAGTMFTRTSFICGYGKRGLGVAACCWFVLDFVATEGRRQGLERMPAIQPVLHNGPLFVFRARSRAPSKVWACAHLRSGLSVVVSSLHSRGTLIPPRAGAY